MTKNTEIKLFGLLGKNISYSFSRGYFKDKFKQLGLDNFKYLNFDLKEIKDFKDVLNNNPNIKGLNITIPYKEEIFPFLDKIDATAKKIGAVNTIKFTKRGNLKGFNTDAFGFENSLLPLLKSNHKKALILGTGGASKAIAFVLKKNNIKFKFVSRNPTKKKEISYLDINKELLLETHLIINCTPLGTSPNVKLCPELPYQYLSKNHLLYDLIYNPEVTTFLSKGKEKGATIKNGLEMLQLQAEESWRIWNS